jgi:hypothetical protein
MYTAALAAISLLAAAAVSAQTAPSLEQAYLGMSQSVAQQAAALQQSVKANVAKAAAAAPAPKAHEFYLDYQRGWSLNPDPNPPGSGLVIDVAVGELVRLHLVNSSFSGDSAQFDVDGIKAMVNGKASDGIHVWLASTGDSAVVEFTATEAGIHVINGSMSVGMIVIRGQAALAVAAPAKADVFYLDYDRGWHLNPNPNPPGSGLTIYVKVGEPVRLQLSNSSFGFGDDSAQFDVDGIDATVDGKPGKGIHVWLASSGDSAAVEFTATAAEAGIHVINGSLSAGSIIVTK